MCRLVAGLTSFDSFILSVTYEAFYFQVVLV
jgi:hypothetical protein